MNNNNYEKPTLEIIIFQEEGILTESSTIEFNVGNWFGYE